MKSLNMAFFQRQVSLWMNECFGPEITNDKEERSYRFLEEALELFQATGMSKADCMALVEYVYARERGVEEREVGDVMITLGALCLAHKIDLEAEVDDALRRVWLNIDEIREKQANKPIRSPLPGPDPKG